MDLVLNEGRADYILDALAVTETRPDATLDNRHYRPSVSNVPFALACELIRLLARIAVDKVAAETL